MRHSVSLSLAAFIFSASASFAASEDCASSRSRVAFERHNTPPVSTALFANENYLVGPQGTNDFAGKDNNWARWNGSTWSFEIPDPCDRALLGTDYVRTTVGDRPVLDSELIFDSSEWKVADVGFQGTDFPHNADTKISVGDLDVHSPVRVWKSNNSTYTYTLPVAIPSFGAAQVIVSNRGTGGAISVVVASSGLINGSSEYKVEPGQTATFTFVGYDGFAVQWHAH